VKSFLAVAVIVAGLYAGQSGNGGLVVAALVVAAVLAFGVKLSGIAGHSHAGGRATVARHEAGHVVGARAAKGGRVLSARVYAGGGGKVKWDHTPGSLVEEVTANVAFLRAGAYAAGTSAGCGSDQAAIRAQLRRLPSGERSKVQARGEARARQIVSSRRSEIERVAAKLDRDGKL
jgi:hypothetical protein